VLVGIECHVLYAPCAGGRGFAVCLPMSRKRPLNFRPAARTAEVYCKSTLFSLLVCKRSDYASDTATIMYHHACGTSCATTAVLLESF
jgi:hypothetical protein